MAIKKLTESQVKELAMLGINFMWEMNAKHPECQMRVIAYPDGISIIWGVYSAAFGVSKYYIPMSESLTILHDFCEMKGWEPRLTLPKWAK